MQFDFVPPRSWDQFEELCADTFQEEWRDSMLVRHGRAGQAQNGVDIVGTYGALWPVGIQCKKKASWPPSKLTIREVDDEIAKAKTFTPALKGFYLVTTAPDDAPLQEHVRLINEAHQKAGLFPVAVFGWGELVRRATMHTSVASKHFGAFASGQQTPLLKSWSAARGKLLLDDKTFSVEIGELRHLFEEFPGGRLVIQQKEADDLAFQISAAAANDRMSLDDRQKIVDLRDDLRALTSRQKRAVRAVHFLLTSRHFKDLIAYAWQKEAPLLLRSMVEYEIDKFSPGITEADKIRLAPMNYTNTDDIIPLHLSSSEAKILFDHQQALRKKYPKINLLDPDELPDAIRFGRVIPRIVSKAFSRVDDEGASLADFEARDWFAIEKWRIVNG